MSKEVETKNGSIVISDNVISFIAGMASMGTYGLVGMASQSLIDGIAQILKWENVGKGVEVQVDEDGANIKLYVIVSYGTKISVVAQNIIDRVSYSLKEKCGLTVKNIEINVRGVIVNND